MTDDRSLERAARSWIEEGPTQAPDRAVEAALLRIESTSQERDLRVPWRLPTMTTPVRVATAAVIGVLAVGGAVFMLGRPSETGVGAPGPSPTPVVSVAPSTGPTAAPSTRSVAPSNAGPLPLPDGPLAAGTYVSTPFAQGGLLPSCMTPPQPGCSESEDDTIGITLTVPDGWAGVGSAVWLAAEENSAPAGAAVGYGRGSWLHSDPCLTPAQDAAPDGAPPDVAVGPSVDDFANALADHPLLEATDPVPVTLGGYSGKYIDLQLPSDITRCPTLYFPWEPGIYAQGPGHRWHLWILDVDGVRVVVQAMDYAGTSPEARPGCSRRSWTRSRSNPDPRPRPGTGLASSGEEAESLVSPSRSRRSLPRLADAVDLGLTVAGRILLFWRARRDSNPRHSVPKTDALVH